MANTQPSDDGKVQVDLVEIVQHGTAFVLPEDMDLDAAEKVIKREKAYRTQPVAVNATIEGFVPDVANAFYLALKEIYGWVHGIPSGFFGMEPPMMLTVRTGLNSTIQVPWGAMKVPGLDGYLQTDAAKGSDGRFKFVLTGEVKRKDKEQVDKIVKRTREILKEQSIFKGKAFSIRLTDDAGRAIALPEPAFLDINPNLKDELIFSREVEDAIKISVFTPIERTEAARRLKVPRKRGVLLYGTFGTGKSMTSTVVADKAVANGWTFIMVERATELKDVLRLAVQYGPAVVFCEDIDRVTSGDRSIEMNDLLNIVDGVESKASELMVVFTTNEVERIHRAMLRPGRLDAIIEVLPPDADAVARLMHLYGRGTILADADLSVAGGLLAGQIPAVIQEAVERSKLAALLRNPDLKDIGPGTITGDDLAAAARSMRNQLELLREKQPDTRSNRERAAEVIATAIRETGTAAPAVATANGSHVPVPVEA